MSGPRFLPYLRAQLKRAMALLPPALAAGALLLAAVGLLLFAAGEDHAGDISAQKLRIGVAGDLESNALIRAGIYALGKLDVSRFSIELAEAEEAECGRLLRAGELDAYLVVPEGFEEALARGETRPVRYVSTTGAAALGTALFDEAARAASELLLRAENAVYGAQEYLADPAAGDVLAEEYLALLLDRDKLFATEILGVGAGLDFSDYYVCAMTLLFPLLWGAASAPLFARTAAGPRRMLYARGFGAARQVFAEYLAYMVLLLLGCVLFGAAAGLLLSLLPELAEALGTDAAALTVRLFRAAAPVLVFGAMQLWLSGTADGLGGALLQFLAALGMAYVCGLFYPSGVFPAALQTVGSILPAGAGFRWLSAPDVTGGLLLGGWLAAFLLLAIFCRSRRLRGGAA